MPTLHIHLTAENGWIASVANSGGKFHIFKAIEGDQEISMMQLANAMKMGQGEVVKAMEAVFNIPEGTDAAEVALEIFKTADLLYFADGTAPIYGAVAEDMLWDDIEAAGEALARAVLDLL